MQNSREHWASKVGFLLATAGSAIGLGSLWRFPYMTGANGGGLFVLMFIGFTFLIGIPVFMGELLMGRKSQKSPVQAFASLSNNSQIWRMVGWLSILTTFIILSYYFVISGWALNYAFMSLNEFYLNKTPDQISNTFNILYKSPQMNIFWQAVFIFMTAGIVMSGIRKGIEHWSKILMPTLFIILIGLFIFSMTLPGAGQALKFVFSPNVDTFKPSSVLNALGMAFFALSVGLGILITYGSYMTKDQDIPKTAFIVGGIDVGVSILAALMIFPIIFTFNFQPEEGVGLIFKALPLLFTKLPATLILSTIFFLLLVFTALTSTISLLEVLVATCMEVFDWTRKKSAVITSAACFVFGIPTACAGANKIFPQWEMIYGKNFFETFDYITGSWFLPISGMLSALFVGWKLTKDIRYKEFIDGSQMKWLYKPWMLLLKYLVPLAVILIILNQSGVVNFDSLFK